MRRAALVIYSSCDFGGAERRLIRIYNELGKDNSCDIIVRGSSELDFKERLINADCNVSNINKILYFSNNLQCLGYLVLRGKYEAIHYIDLCGFNVKLAMALRFSKVKTVLTIAYQNYAYGLIDNNIEKKLINLLNLSNHIDVLFPAAPDYFRRITKNKNITVTPGTFTYTDIFIPDRKEKLILFAAARLEKDKNAELLIEACRLCKDSLMQMEYTVMICGCGFEEQYLKHLICEYGLDEIVKMPGYIRISDVIPKAEVFVNIDRIENYPSQSIAEAVSCGCALICTDVGHSRRCGADSFTEFIADNHKELADAMIKFSKMKPDEKEKIVYMAREYAIHNYSIEASIKYFSGGGCSGANRFEKHNISCNMSLFNCGDGLTTIIRMSVTALIFSLIRCVFVKILN